MIVINDEPQGKIIDTDRAYAYLGFTADMSVVLRLLTKRVNARRSKDRWVF
jgi:hypothetical protein